MDKRYNISCDRDCVMGSRHSLSSPWHIIAYKLQLGTAHLKAIDKLSLFVQGSINVRSMLEATFVV